MTETQQNSTLVRSKLVQSGHSGHGSVLVVNRAVADLLFVVDNARMEQLELIAVSGSGTFGSKML